MRVCGYDRRRAAMNWRHSFRLQGQRAPPSTLPSPSNSDIFWRPALSCLVDFVSALNVSCRTRDEEGRGRRVVARGTRRGEGGGMTDNYLWCSLPPCRHWVRCCNSRTCLLPFPGTFLTIIMVSKNIMVLKNIMVSRCSRLSLCTRLVSVKSFLKL